MVEVCKLACLSGFDQVRDDGIIQQPAENKGREHREWLAARNGGVVVWVKHSCSLASKVAVALSALEIIEKPVFANNHWVEIDGSKYLGGMIAHVTGLENRAFDLSLNTEAPLLHIGCPQIGVGKSEGSEWVNQVVLLKGAGHFEDGYRNSGKTGAHPSAKSCLRCNGDEPLIMVARCSEWPKGFRR